MSLITRCAHCHTVFRITPEQLQAHGGQVRCGRCMQVFNGLATLAPDSAMAATAPAAPAMPESAVTNPELKPATEPVAGPVVPPRAAQPQPQPIVGPEPAVVADEVVATGSEHTDAPETLLEPLPAPVGNPGPLVRTEAEGPAVAAIDDDNPFVEEVVAEEPVRIRRPLLVAASVLLGLILIAQAVYFYRGEIAARHPLARHWLNEACAEVGCLVQLPQRPKSVLIEASDLQVVDPARPGRIQLTATLRNHAGHDVAYPALDLVLTNVNDHTLVRRIFLPAEYLGAQRDPRAGIAANAELTVRLAMEIGNLGAAGFRLAVLPAPPS